MAGGFVGEKAAMLVAKLLAKTPLAQIPDPIMNDGRMLVRDPDGDKEEKGDKTEGGTGGETKTPPKKPQKIDKIFKSRRSGAEYDLSKEMGGLSREDFDALDTIERKRILQRQTIWQGQNKKEWADNIKGNANNIVPTKGVSNKVNGVSSSASYEDSVEVIDGQEAYDKGYSDGSNTGEKTESTEQKVIPVVMGESGGTDSVSEQMYASG